ncbi:phage tail protein [Bacillus horti]|uniref:Microcystin-dependent protein n=1 Tax=Caldalkalibacillus horti TaxID=77523 RepID=A0ABT9VYX3_9BACI|nr:tail fiber protein [Bacillus horti]MDQ0166195.1 microcystin-dependent protein [Bacillus horti]
MIEAYIGLIVPWAGKYPPAGWMFCNGQELSIESYQTLYSLIGTYYGGNGKTTFALPNLNGRIPVGVSVEKTPETAYSWSTTGGNERIALTVQNMPDHTHQATSTVSGLTVSGLNVQFPASTGPSNTASPSDQASLATSQGASIYTTGQPNTNLKSATVTGGSIDGQVTTNVSPMGYSTPIDNRQPYLALNYIICYLGLYPSRF